MNLLNKVMMIGNLTQDPELRQTGSGTSVTELRLAINSVGGGKPQDEGGRSGQAETVFVDVALWERLAENAAQYLKKGSSVLIEGRLRMDRWEDKATGKVRTKLKVTGDQMRFLNLNYGDGEREKAPRTQQADS